MNEWRPEAPILELSWGEKLFLHTRTLIGIAACLIVAVVMGWRSFAHTPPRKAQLKTIEGVLNDLRVVKHSSKDGLTYFMSMHVAGHRENFVYLDWFPDSEGVSQGLETGDQVRFLSDTPKNSWIWQIEKNGRTLVSYEQVLAAVRNNNRYDPYIALVFGILGATGVWRYSRWSKEEHIPSEARQL